MAPLYDFKDRIDGTWGLAFGMDYNFLNQYASFSFTEDQATSGNFRFYGTWNLFHSKEKFDGRLVYRIENRHTIGGGFTPRDLGFDAGSALSTASFKDFAWGLTRLCWKQFFSNRKYAFTFGQMDPGDSIHVTYWVQDELEEKGTERSRGLAFSAARQIYDGACRILGIENDLGKPAHGAKQD